MKVEEKKTRENPPSRGAGKNSYAQLQTKTCRPLKDQKQSAKNKFCS
jgi:hypothetical protein